MGDIYTNPPQSRNEAILRATIDGTEYTDPPQSRIEDLLLELKQAIEEGGGTGEGDMKKVVYDADRAVQNAGGIAAYVDDEITDLELGSASKKNSIAVVTSSTDLVESGAVKKLVGWGNKNKFDLNGDSITSNTTRTVLSDGINVKSSSASWASYIYFFKNVKNTDMRFKTSLDFVSGHTQVTVYGNSTPATAGATSIISSEVYTADGDVDLQFNSGDYEYLIIRFFVTTGTAEVGEANFNSIMLCNASDGNTYEPCHESVAEYCASKELLEDTVGWLSENLFTTINATENKYLRADGTEGSLNNFAYTDYISVQEGKYYLAKDYAGNSPAICFYDASKNYLRGIAYNGEANLVIDTYNASYVRISYKKDGNTTFSHCTVEQTITQKIENALGYPLEKYSGADTVAISKSGTTSYTTDLVGGFDSGSKYKLSFDITAISGFNSSSSLRLQIYEKSDTSIKILQSVNLTQAVGHYEIEFNPLVTLSDVSTLQIYIQSSETGTSATATLANISIVPPSVNERKCDNSVIGPVEDGTNPTKSYAVGEHMIKGGKFCTVTVAVTTSSTWTLGSNYVEGTIADLCKFFTAGLSSEVGTISNATAYQAGNLVSYMFRFSPTDDIVAGTNIAIGMKNPFVAYNCMAAALFTDANYNTYRVVLNYTSGTAYFKVLDNIPAGTNIRGSITYICQL